MLDATNDYYVNLQPGDIVEARGQIGVVVDVLQSAATNRICIYIRFIFNIGNSRPYDMLELTPERAIALEVNLWKPATHADLDAAIEKRRELLENEFREVKNLASRRQI